MNRAICVFLLLQGLFGLCFALPAQGREGEKVLLLPFEGPVDVGRAHAVENAVRRAIEEEEGYHLLLVIDSPGGQVSYMEQILRAIDRAREAGVRSVAWIRGNAWSAAAIIAIGCDRVYMNKASSIGAAEPILLSPVPADGKAVHPAGEKIVSAMRTQARAVAERTNRPALLAAAMVDADIEVLEVLVDGERRFVSRQEWDRIQEKSYEEGFDAVVERTVIEKGKLLSLSAQQAKDFGFVDGLAGKRSEVLEAEGLEGAEVVVISLSWSQNLANFLTLPLISILLLIIGIGGVYIEIKTPGLGVPGIVGVLSLFLFFFGKYAVGLAEIHEILFFFAGIVLILVEVFVTPGFGIPGIAGIALVLLGLFLSSQDFIIPSDEAEWVELQTNVLQTMFSLGGTVVVLLILGWVLPKSPLFHRLTLRAPITETPLTGSAVQQFKGNLEGLQGRAETHLRPSGKGRFEEQVLDIVTEGGFVDKGERIEIRRVEGNRIVVVSIEPPVEEEDRA
jgi:membrane-bound serine protease (ClpP class)